MEDTQNHNEAPNANNMEPKKNYTKWIVVGVVVLAALYGFQMFFSPGRMMERNIERAIERETGADVDIEYEGGMMNAGDTNVTFKGEDGESYSVSAGEDVALPNNWPSSVPLPSDAKITYAGTMMMGQPGSGMTVSYTTKQSISDIIEFYKRELAGNGWTITAAVATTDGSMLNATRADGEMVGLYVGTSPDGTTVSMSVQAQN